MTEETKEALSTAEAALSTATVDTATVAADAATDIKHDAERDTRHRLAHLETWFVDEAKSIASYLGSNIAEMESEAKTLLARLAAKL